MKVAIIEKLFNGQELEGSELIEVTKALNLVEDTDIKPYNHTEGTVFEACSISENDIDELNQKVSDFSKDSKCISEIVERCETLMDLNVSYKRLIIIQAIKYMKASNDPFFKMLLGI
jgi:hypothetical protein